MNKPESRNRPRSGRGHTRWWEDFGANGAIELYDYQKYIVEEFERMSKSMYLPKDMFMAETIGQDRLLATSARDRVELAMEIWQRKHE